MPTVLPPANDGLGTDKSKGQFRDFMIALRAWAAALFGEDGEAATARAALGAIGGPGESTNNGIVLWDGTGATTVKNSPAVGTAAYLNAGTGAGNIVQLTEAGALPAVSGANLTGLNIGNKFNCYLTTSGSNLILLPVGSGKQITISGTNRTLPEAGVTLAPSGLTINTLYYIYAIWDGSSVVLNALTNVPTYNYSLGYPTHPSDTGYTLVGVVYVLTGPAFVNTPTQRYVASFWNRKNRRLLSDVAGPITSTSDTLAAVSGSPVVQWIMWSDDMCVASLNGRMTNTTADAGSRAGWRISGSTTTPGSIAGAVYDSESGGTGVFPLALSIALSGDGNPMTAGTAQLDLVGARDGGGTVSYTELRLVGMLRG